MKTQTRSVQKIVEEQVQRWTLLSKEKKKEETLPVITVSREPGSGGRLVAKGVAERLGFDLFHQEVIHEMAKSAQVSNRLVETLDEKGISMIEDWISAAISERHLWPDEYLKHLLNVIGAIAGHGRAVLVGRGANFLIPADKRFRVRIIAPREVRIKHMMREFKLSAEDAKSRIIKTESDRRAFIRKYFHSDIAEPSNYDLIVNTGTVAIEDAVKTICCAIGK